MPWKELDIDIVFECTGRFVEYDKAMLHVKAGAKKVLISAPGKGNMKTIVYNVNDNLLNSNDVIVSPLYYAIHKLKKDTLVIYNIEDTSKNHIFQIYILHFIVAIILFFVSITELKKTIYYKRVENI